MRSPTDKLNTSRSPVSMASSTNANATAFVNVGVFWRKLVTAFAACLMCAFGPRAFAAHDVFILRDRFKVCGIDAGWNPAKMIEDKSIWNRANEKFVCDSMGRAELTVPHDMPIAKTGFRCGPQPACLCFVDSLPKAFLLCSLKASSGASACFCISTSEMSTNYNDFGSTFTQASPQGASSVVYPSKIKHGEFSEFQSRHVFRCRHMMLL